MEHSDSYGDLLPPGALARIGTSRMRARYPIAVIAFSTDGRHLAYGSEDSLVCVCEAADGKPLFELRPERDRISSITALAFSPDGRNLAAGGIWSKSTWLIDLEKRKIQYTLGNTADTQDRWSRESQGPSLAFTADGKSLVGAGKDGAVHVWDVATGIERAALSQTTNPIFCLTLSADGNTALTAHRDGELHLWDIPNRRHQRRLTASAKYPQFTALAPDGKIIALGTYEAVELWDVNGKRQHLLTLPALLAGLAFTPDGGLQLADAKGNISMWDTATGKQRHSLACNVNLVETIARPSAWFQPGGKLMAWGEAGTVRPWDLATGLEKPRLDRYRHGIQWAGFSSDGELLRTGGPMGELGAWDGATGRAGPAPYATETNRSTTGVIGRTTYNPALDRRKVIITTGAASSGGQIVVWDTADSHSVLLSRQVDPAWSAVLTPDNRFLVAAEERGQIRVYDALSGKPVRAFDGREHEYQLAVSPSGRLLATTGSQGTVRLYDFAEGRKVRDLEGACGVSCIAFSPDSRVLATGHYAEPLKQLTAPKNVICLWDAVSGRELRRISTDHSDVSALSFSPDGALIASCEFMGIVKIWETASGEERRRYKGHQHRVHSVDFAPDGRRLASSSADGTALVWQLFDPAPSDRSVANLEALWARMTEDGLGAHRAIAALIAAKGTPAYLAKRLKPAIQPGEEDVTRWLADLGSPRFQIRLGAQKQLTDHGDLIESRIRRALDMSADLEIQRRLVAVLSVVRQAPCREHLRDLRATEVLGHIGTPEARRILEDLAKGAPEGNLTRQARARLARLERKQ